MKDLQRFSFEGLPVTAWRNGGGETREIISWPAGQTPFDWRASIATIAADGPFSRFEGIDRSIALLSGEGVQLMAEGEVVHRLSHRAEPFVFAGETPVQARLINGITTDFNIMTRRTKASARVTPQRLGFTASRQSAGILYVLQGQWQVGDSLTLAPSEGLFWTHGDAIKSMLNVQPLLADSLLLRVDIEANIR